MREKLPVSEQLFLVHDPSHEEGKTAGMAKGLFLGYQDEIFAGESAGFGLPVWKTARKTYFPTLVVSRRLRENLFVAVYRLELAVRWQLLGVRMPQFFSTALEILSRGYMQRPRNQQFLLKVRDVLFGLLRTESTMGTVPSQGDCRVMYETRPGHLLVTVDGRKLQGDGDLILHNEVAGRPFNRLRVGSLVQEGSAIPAWQSCPFTAILENPAAGIGFSLLPSDGWLQLDVQLAAGREVGRRLNWAGLELTVDQQRFCYGISFSTAKQGHRYAENSLDRSRDHVTSSDPEQG
jgi:hypothetical protein